MRRRRRWYRICAVKEWRNGGTIVAAQLCRRLFINIQNSAGGEHCMAVNGDIWVFSEKWDLLAELAAGARELAGEPGSVTIVVIGPRSAAEKAAAWGKVLWLGEVTGQRRVDDYVPTLVGMLEEAKPQLMLIGATRRGRAIAGRIAARFDTAALTDVQEFLTDEDGLPVRHMIFGGGAVRVERALREPVIATLGPGIFQAVQQPAGAGGGIVEQAAPIEPAFVEPKLRAQLRERKPRPPVTANLGAARRVVCAGRGLAKQEDLSIVEALARALNAEVACTRPLAEGLDWLPRERYIGISGAIIRPELYLGVGVSGQAQHVIGMSESRVVVAVNKDANAPICQQADYIVNEDLYVFLPALIAALEKR